MQAITAQELKNARSVGTNAQIVDVRTLREYINFRIPGAAFLPLRHVHRLKVPLRKNLNVYAISEKGHRAKEFCQILDALGYNTFYLEGGLKAWARQNYPVQHSPKMWSLKHLMNAGWRFLRVRESQNSQSSGEIQNVNLRMPPKSELAYYFNHIILIALFFEHLGINIKFIFANGHNYFENSILLTSGEYQAKNSVTFPPAELYNDVILNRLFCKEDFYWEYGHKVTSQLLISQDLQKQADKWSHEYLADNWVGVHYRGTDQLKKRKYHTKTNIDLHIAYLKKVIDEGCNIFACSDQAQFIEQLHLAFPDRVFCRDITRSYDSRSLHMTPKYSGFQQRKDAMIDLLILSKAKLIYKATGNFSFITKFLNPKIKIFELRESSVKKY